MRLLASLQDAGLELGPAPGRGLRNQAGQHEDEGKLRPQEEAGRTSDPAPPSPCHDIGTLIVPIVQTEKLRF